MRSVLLVLLMAFATSLLAQTRVAVWDPQKGTSEIRFRLDPAAHDRVAGWLETDGITVSRVTAEQVADPVAFSASQYDVFVLAGEAVPRDTFANLKKFTEDGGVVVAFDATVPFLIGIAKEPDGSWTMSPKTPTFAWQTNELLAHFGLVYHYDTTRHNLGFHHRITPLFKKYLPGVADIEDHRLPSLWVAQHKDEKQRGKIYPLIRSLRIDGKDAPPQIYLAERDGRRAIICIGRVFTEGNNPQLWSAARETVVAMARLAGDLKSGKVTPGAEDEIQLPVDMAGPPPLAFRPGRADIDPPHVRSIVRWGRFNGSSLDLPERPSAQSPLARVVLPGETVKLPVPELTDATTQVRMRIAYDKSGGILQLSAGGKQYHSERLSYLDASGIGNYDAPSLAGVPAEITRIVLIGRQPAGVLELANPGKEPFYIDAIQVEVPDGPQRKWQIGLNANQGHSYEGGKVPIPVEISQRWDRLRAGMRTQFVGEPGKPDRWERSERILKSSMDMNPRIELILEGTPPWAAISPERLEEARKAGRPHVVPPDPVKYAKLVEEIIERHGDRIDAYEIWNEPNIKQFWRGTAEEYVQFFNTVVPVIRKNDPTAMIILAGMAGVNDDFVQTLAAGGVFEASDLLSIHPYAGRSPAWDMVYGQFEGLLMSMGITKEIYCNESGFPFKNSEWFRAPPVLDEDVQAWMLDVAMGRLTASGACKIVVFHCGGDDHHFGLFDRAGRPRPGYHVMEDYMRLSGRDGRWCSLSLANEYGDPLTGIYAVASAHEDGSFTVVVNTSSNLDLQPTKVRTPSWTFDDLAGWTYFNGRAKATKGLVELTVAEDKQYIGFYAHGKVDRANTPLLRIKIAEADRPLNFFMTIAGKEQVILKEIRAGEFDVRLDELLPPGLQDVQVTFRCQGRTVIDEVRFLNADGSEPEPEFMLPANISGIPAKLRLPLTDGKKYSAQTVNGEILTMDEDGAINVPLRQRMVIEVWPVD